MSHVPRIPEKFKRDRSEVMSVVPTELIFFGDTYEQAKAIIDSFVEEMKLQKQRAQADTTNIINSAVDNNKE